MATSGVRNLPGQVSSVDDAADSGIAPRYAGLWIRFTALAIDGLLCCAIFFPVTRLVKGVWLMSPGDHDWVSGWFIFDPLCLAFLVAMFCYFSVLEGCLGATVGKRIVGVRVACVGGGRPGLGRGLVRNFLRLVDGLPAFCILGIVLIVTSPEHARLGDRLAGTRVLRSAS
jgi:uncharacterized RDD family membrane protein YckC